jgi:hypothetical protein
MKAFLMYRDRDFDPGLLVSRKERAARSESAEQAARMQKLLPWNWEALTQDLGLEVICGTMAAGDPFLFDVASLALLSSLTDQDAIQYRQNVLSDCLQNRGIVTEIYTLAVEVLDKERKGSYCFFVIRPASSIVRSKF